MATQSVGPTPGTAWMSLQSGDWVVDSKIRIDEQLQIAPIVTTPTVVVGDNINALKWASIDAITPGNKHVRTAYH